MPNPAASPAPEAGSGGDPVAPAGGALVVAGAAVLAAVISGAVALNVLGGIPHVTDGAAYLFQARIFAGGELTLEPPPLAPLFAHEGVVVDGGGWHAFYPFGWPALLALAWRARAVWLLNPLLLALAVVGTALAGRRLYGRGIGTAAAVLLAASPFALLMAAGELSHVAALCAVGWTLWALARAVDRGEPRAMALAGALGGVALVVRPPTAVFCLAPLVVWALLRFRGGRWAALGWAAVGVAPWAAALVLYNGVLFDDWLRGGFRHKPPGDEFFAGSGWAEVAGGWWRRTRWYAARLGESIWGLPLPDLVLLVPLLLPARDRGRDLALAVSATCLVVGYAAYSYQGVFYSGPRYVFEALVPLCLLVARAGAEVGRRSVSALAGRGVSAARLRALRWTAVALLAAVLWLPLGRRLPAQIDRLSGWYLGVSPIPMEAGRRAGVAADALVFVAGTPWCYTAFFPWTSLHPRRGGPVYVRDVPALRREVMATFPRSQSWIVRVVVRQPDPRFEPDRIEPVSTSWQRLR